MGRYITCNDDIVWKYRFGEQASEMGRINEELGIGTYKWVRYEIDGDVFEALAHKVRPKWIEINPEEEQPEGDVLILTKEDLPALDSRIAELEPGELFTEMVKAIREYVAESKDDQVVLESEF